MNDAILLHAPILIVDDQEANLALVEAILRRAGYANLTSVSDPRLVAALCQATPPALILLDLHMPQLDGFSVMAQVQETVPMESRPPIVVLTADVSVATRRRALEAGAHDFIGKPFVLADVLHRVRAVLEYSHSVGDVAG